MKQSNNSDLAPFGRYLLIAVFVVLILLYFFAFGFSWGSLSTTLSVLDLSYFGLIIAILACNVISLLIVVNYAIMSSSPIGVPEDELGWLVPLLKSLGFLLLYGTYSLITDNFFVELAAESRYFENTEILARVLSIIVFLVYVLIGCLYIRKHPHITPDDLGISPPDN